VLWNNYINTEAAAVHVEYQSCAFFWTRLVCREVQQRPLHPLNLTFKLTSTMRAILLAIGTSTLAAANAHDPRAAHDAYWLLAGDSTTAPKGGWGDAFLSTAVASGSSGHNYGHSGATTNSFRSADWSKVIRDIGTYKSQYNVYVTIQVSCSSTHKGSVMGRCSDSGQFGHNDQKAASGITIADYKSNLARFASEVISSGATPILLTPLTRRSFDKNTHKVIENLVDQRGATIEVAQANSLKWVDLNKASTDYINSIGQQAASNYNLDSGDWTHLNAWGSVVFARMVSDLLASTYPSDFIAVTKKNETLSALIKAGKPA
jgi:hypothetical protein